MSGEQAAELFGGESSSEEEEEDEEDSSEDSSGEQENQDPEAAGVEGGTEGRGVGGGAEDSSSSSSSGESGSASEAEESEPDEGGVASESSPQQPPDPANPVQATGASDALTNAQNLFGETSSSSSSDSEDGGGVIGDIVGGEGVRSGGEEEEEGGSPADDEFRSPQTRRQQARERMSESPAVQSADQTVHSDDEAMESEDRAGRSADGPTQTVEGLFGDAADLSSSDSDGEGVEGGLEKGGLEKGGLEKGGLEKGGLEKGEVETEVPRINVEIPRCAANLGSDQYFVKLPNFLSVDTRPFDPAVYEDEVEDESEILDEEGRARLKLKVENTIRWRYSQDETGNEVRESNARMVRWSDGTMSLYLGSEIFDIHRQPLQGEFSHLFVRQGTGLQGQAVFHTKLTFRPHSTDSQTHRKMTLSIADRFSKTQKIRVLPAVGKDPESQKKEKIKKEEEKLRAAVRRENQQKRVRERHSQKGLTASFIEPDREDDDEDSSVAAIKSSYRSRLSEMRGARGGGMWGGAESEGESSEEEGAERLMRAKADDVEASSSRKRHLEHSEVESSHKKQPRRKFLHSDDSEDSV